MDTCADPKVRDPTRDVLRGVNVLEMSFVNICSISCTNHSGYIDQPSYADQVFPCFAFIAGMSKTSVQRAVGLVGLGLGLNFLGASTKGDTARILGVLQRLGLAAMIANLSILEPLRAYCGLPLVALWYCVSLGLGSRINPFAHPAYPEADPKLTAQTRIDNFFVGHRLYTPAYDPEGLLGSLTTAVTMLIGRQFATRKLTMAQRTLTGVSLIAIGELLHLLLPRYCAISKPLWTPSFVLITCGIAMLKYVAVQVTLPYLPRYITSLLQALGQRSLEVYLLSSITQTFLQKGGHKSVWFSLMAQLEPLVGRYFSDLLMSLTFTGLMAQAASYMVQNKIKLF